MWIQVVKMYMCSAKYYSIVFVIRSQQRFTLKVIVLSGNPS